MRRSKAVVIPMLVVPIAAHGRAARSAVGLAARAPTPTSAASSARCPATSLGPILDLPAHEQLVVLVNGYLLAPLFLIVPLMVSAVLAADAFAGEKERTHARVAAAPADRATATSSWPSCSTAFLPAIAVSWIGFLSFCDRGQRRGMAGDAPRVRAHPALARDDPLGGTGRRHARPRR